MLKVLSIFKFQFNIILDVLTWAKFAMSYGFYGLQHQNLLLYRKYCRNPCDLKTILDDNDQVLRKYEYPIDVRSVLKRRLFLHFASAGHIVDEIFGVTHSEALRKTPLIGSYVDSDLILLEKLALVGQFYRVPECLFQHREHTGRSTLATGGVEGFTHWHDSSKSGNLRSLENS